VLALLRVLCMLLLLLITGTLACSYSACCNGVCTRSCSGSTIKGLGETNLGS
jgi:hypothetical protein